MELSALRADRALRIEVFESLEPDDLAVKNLVLGVRKQVTKDAVWGDRMRIARYIASAAAVVVISFSAGWLGKSRVAIPNHGAQDTVTVAQRDNAGSADYGGDKGGNQGVGTPVSNMHLPQSTARQSGGYQVNLIDAFGHVVAQQHFNTLDEAHQFQEDVGQYEKQQQQNRGAEPVDYVDYPVDHRGQF
jgi:hypothetical protein